MVRRWHFLMVIPALFASQAYADNDRAGLIAALAVRYAAIVCVPRDAPKPPSEGCAEGCKCNGTGKERSGDGLAIVNCRCDDDCECKAGKQEPDKPVAVEPPPLRRVEQPVRVYVTPSRYYSYGSSCGSGSCR